MPFPTLVKKPCLAKHRYLAVFLVRFLVLPMLLVLLILIVAAPIVQSYGRIWGTHRERECGLHTYRSDNCGTNTLLDVAEVLLLLVLLLLVLVLVPVLAPVLPLPLLPPLPLP